MSRRPQRPHPPGAVLAKLALALGALAATLLAAELVLRALGPAPGSSPYHVGGAAGVHELTVPDRDLLFRLKPGAEFLGYYRIGPRGWRGQPDVADAPAAGVTRIICTGDSTTFGMGVREARAWPAVLQRLLDVLFEGVAGFEVINAGVPGYSTWQNRLQIEGDLLALRPDVLVWHVSGYNDASGTRSLSDAEATARNREADGGSALLKRLGFGNDDTPPPAQQGLLQPGWGARRRVSTYELAENLAAGVRAAAARDAEVVLVVPHHSEEARALSDELPATAPIVERVGAQTGARLARPAPSFAEHAPFELYVDSIHPDARGQALLALSVLESLLGPGGPLPDGPRTRWVADWLIARRDGLAEAPTLRAADLDPEPLEAAPTGAPPPAVVLLAAPQLDDDVPASWLAAGDGPLSASELFAARADFDPLNGARASARSAAAWALLATRAPPLVGPRGVELQPPTAARLQRHLERLLATTVPPDPFTRLLLGVDARHPTDQVVRLARALVVLEHVLGIAARPRDKRLQYAEDLRQRGKLEGALQTVDGALELDPFDVDALWLRSSLLAALGRPEEAAADSARVVELEPDGALGHALVGREALRAGRLDEAEASLRAAIERDPAAVLARYLLGRTLLELRRLDEAEVQLKTAAAFGQAFDIAELLDEIERLR